MTIDVTFLEQGGQAAAQIAALLAEFIAGAALDSAYRDL